MKFDISNILSLAILATTAKVNAIPLPEETTPVSVAEPVEVPVESDNSTLLEIKEKCGEENFIEKEGQYACLKPYDKDIPTSIEEILVQRIVSYQDGHRIIDPLYSSQCSESTDILDCYINVAELIGEDVTALIPKLDDSAEEVADKTKKGLSEYYCGKDNFYEVNGKYVCLVPYHGYFNVNVNDMFDKRIVHYNDEYFFVNYLFSNICELSPDYMQCYTDLVEIFEQEMRDLLPLYNYQTDTPESRNPLAEGEVDIEEILDKYRCGLGNFYSVDNMHLCLDPCEKSDIPSPANVAMAVGFYLRYNGQYYKVNKTLSSMALHIAGNPIYNYEKIAQVLGTTIEEIAPKTGDSIDEEIDLIINSTHCTGKYITNSLNKFACLKPYEGAIPATAEEKQSEGIVVYKDEYYQIEAQYSNVCVDDVSVECEEELATFTYV